MARSRKTRTESASDADTPPVSEETGPAAATEDASSEPVSPAEPPSPETDAAEPELPQPEAAAEGDAGPADAASEPMDLAESGTESADPDAEAPEPATPDADVPEATDAAEAPQPELEQEPEPERETAAAAPPPSRRGGGFLATALGGAVAAGLGFGAAVYVLPQYWTPSAPPEEMAALAGQLNAQNERIAALTAEIEALRIDPAAVLAAEEQAAFDAKVRQDLEALRQNLGGLDDRLAREAQRIGALDTRLATVEKRPVASGAASATAIEAFGREVAALRAEVETQQVDATAAQERITAAAEQAALQIRQAEEEAARLHEEAAEATRQAAVRAAVGRLQAALESGASLEAGLADLSAAGLEVPQALAEQEQGVPSLTALRDDFPSAARDALAASLKETVDGDAWARIGAFLRSQSGARSLSPRAGDDPDAILSRAEAALGAGDLAMAISEIAALPSDGQARMAEWVALAERRMAAAEAVAALARETE